VQWCSNKGKRPIALLEASDLRYVQVKKIPSILST
jgi:hypothetical protein